VTTREKLKQGYLRWRSFALSLLPSATGTAIDLKSLHRIGVLRIDRLGDLVLSMAVFSELKLRFPHSQLIACVADSFSELVKTHAGVDIIHVFPSRGHFWKKILSAIKLRRLKADLIIDLEASYRLLPLLCCILSGAKIRAGFALYGKERFYHLPYHPENERMHLSTMNQKLIEKITAKPFESSLFCSAAALGKLNQDSNRWLVKKSLPPQETYFIIHPGGTHGTQRWPAERFAAVADSLVQKIGLKCLLLAGPGELPEIQKIAKNMSKPWFFLTHLSLKETMMLISSCKIFLGNNTGTTHLAAYLKKPNVSTLGPTKSWLFKPIGSHSLVIRKNLSCSPCTLVRCSHHSCMKLIDEKEFAKIAEGLIANL
jgi:ADP-heptose:LPS heptosyltransferase